jgi:hypothetical protein
MYVAAMRTLVLPLLLCAGCFLIPRGTPPPPPAGPSPAGIWQVEGGGTLEITGEPERWWGVWHKPGKPPVAIKSVAFDGEELSLVAMELPEPGAFLLRVQPDGRFTGRYAGGKVTGSRLSTRAPDSLRDIDLLPLGPGIVSTDAGESFSALSPDGRDLYFTRHDENFEHHVLHVVHLDGEKVSKSEVLEISGRWDDRTPFVTPDGDHLWFSSNRPAGGGEEASPILQLWVSEKTKGVWGEPRRIDVGREAVSPSLTKSGTLYFCSQGQVFRARLLEGGYEVPRPVPQQKALGVFVSADESMLLTTDGDDLFADGKRLGTPVNSFAHEYGPLLSLDGHWLYFTSDRRGSGDLYRVPWPLLPH